MNNGILSLSWINIKSSIVYGLLGVCVYVISKGTVFGLDWHILVDVGVIGILTSLTKNFFTTDSGDFAGVVKVVDAPPK